MCCGRRDSELWAWAWGSPSCFLAADSHVCSDNHRSFFHPTVLFISGSVLKTDDRSLERTWMDFLKKKKKIECRLVDTCLTLMICSEPASFLVGVFANSVWQEAGITSALCFFSFPFSVIKWVIDGKNSSSWWTVMHRICIYCIGIILFLWGIWSNILALEQWDDVV